MTRPTATPERVPTAMAAFLAVLLVGLALLVAQPARAAEDPAFDAMAAEILDGIADTDVREVPALSGYGAPSIGVRPFSGPDLGVPADVANVYNRRLLARLKQRAGGRFSFVALDTLKTLARAIEATAPSDAEASERIAALRANARVDILISGTIRLDGTVPVLAYHAVGVDNGRLLAATTPRRLAASRLRTAAVEAPPPIPVRRPTRHHRIVAEAEQLLWELGYDPGPVDGVVTRETRAALRAYQADSALPIDGRMSRRVVENLRRDMR